MQAEDVKAALRTRHHAAGGNGAMVGEWTVLEELWGIDVLAWSAWGKTRRVGYEVKVSRSDYRREVLRPHKRRGAVNRCHEFYFAVPAGLLTREELAYREPGDFRPGDFQRVPCPGADMGGPVHQSRHPSLFARDATPPRPVYGGRCHKRRGERKHTVPVPIPAVWPENTGPYSYLVEGLGSTGIPCPTCGGKGYVAKSRVEAEAPTLWVPADVGLVVVHDSGTARVVRRSPTRVPEPISEYEVAKAIRWASVRPDPRHAEARVRPEVV